MSIDGAIMDFCARRIRNMWHPRRCALRWFMYGREQEIDMTTQNLIAAAPNYVSVTFASGKYAAAVALNDGASTPNVSNAEHARYYSRATISNGTV